MYETFFFIILHSKFILYFPYSTVKKKNIFDNLSINPIYHCDLSEFFLF